MNQNTIPNEDLQKELILMVIKKNVIRYLETQKDIIDLLSTQRLVTKCSKKKKCTLCITEKMFEEAARFQGITNEACKTYKAKFGEEIDIKEISKQAKEVIINSLKGEKKGKKSKPVILDGINVPDDAPEDVKLALKKIKTALGKAGMNATVEVIDIKAENFGINPKDYDKFEDYCKAVSEARQAAHDIHFGEKSAEEVLTESMIHKAEAETNHTETKEKLN